MGRLSGPHFELGFQLDSIATMGRKAVEQYGEKSEAIVGVLTKAVSLDCDDQAAHAAPLLGKKGLGESIVKDHGTKKRE